MLNNNTQTREISVESATLKDVIEVLFNIKQNLSEAKVKVEEAQLLINTVNALNFVGAVLSRLDSEQFQPEQVAQQEVQKRVSSTKDNDVNPKLVFNNNNI